MLCKQCYVAIAYKTNGVNILSGWYLTKENDAKT